MEEPTRLHFTRQAMAATFEIILDVDRARQQLHMFAESAFELLAQLENQISAYVPTNDLCWINETAAQRPARIEPRLFELLKTCRRITDETGGAFDVTAGPLVKAWGFYQREGKVPEPAALDEALSRVGMEFVHFDDEDHSVRFEKPGVEINLGAVGKGYVVDRVVEALRGWGVTCALVHSARSSIGVIGKPPVGEGWRLGVTDPRAREKALGSLVLADSSMSTSGNWEQFFKLNDKTYSHILDPKTGQPAQGILSTTVVAGSAAVSDALATAFFVMGVEGTRQFCATRQDIGAVLLAGDSPEEVAVHAFNCTLEEGD